MAKRGGSGTIHWFLFTGGCVALASSLPVQAATSSLSGGISSRYTDNAERSPINEQEDFESRAYVNLQYLSDPGQCSASANMRLGYRYWHKETYDPAVDVNGRLNGQCELLKGLVWQASNTVSEVIQDSRQAANSPDNLSRKNVFRTGPVYTLQLTQVDQLLFSGAYQKTDFEESEEVDSERLTGTVAYNHSFTSTLMGGVTGSTERIELDTGVEFDRESASLTFGKDWGTTNVSGALGMNRLETSSGNQEVSSDGVTWNFALARWINPTSMVSLNANRELTDQTSTTNLQFQDFNFNLTDSAAVEVTTITALYNNQFSDRSGFSAELFASRSDYIQTDNREERAGIALSYDQSLTELLGFFANASYQRIGFGDEDDADQLRSASLGLNYRLTQRMDLRSAIGRQQRVSDIGPREYRENWVSVSLEYQFF